MSPGARRLFSGLAGAAAMIAAVTILSRLLGFVRWLVQAEAVGAGAIGDAYTTANTLPNVLFEVAAGGAIAGALIPVLAGPLARHDRKDVDSIASAMLGWTLAVLVPVAVVLAAASGPIADLLPGRDDGLVQYFIVVFAVQVPLYGVSVVLAGVLQAHKRFFWPAFVPVLSSLVVIAAYLVYGALAAGERSDPDALPAGALAWLALGTTAGVVALSLPLFWPVARLGVRIRPRLRFPAGVAARTRSLAFAGIGALLAQQGAVVVTLVVAGQRGGTGTYPVYLWAQAVYLLPYAVLAFPLATSTFPRLAARASAGDTVGFGRMAAVTTRAVVVAAAVGAAALAAAAPAVADVFATIAGDDLELIRGMGPALTWLAPGLVGLALLLQVSRALYALEQGRTAVLAAAAGWGMVAVATVLGGYLVVGGTPDGPATLAMLGGANSVGMVVAGGGLLLGLRRRAGAAALTGLARTGAVVLLGAVLGAVAGRWIADAVQTLAGEGDVLVALGAGAGGAAVAAALCLTAVLLLDGSIVTDLTRSDRAPGASPRAGSGRPPDASHPGTPTHPVE